ncbi:16S rRNA (cytidine(1402)-2'-O)-methyltransferase [bacterium]|nr:16S rRNA (cytidine(1402)-2'-O)-methyltransferase [bacterium]
MALYVVSTPIGNLSDITLRAIEVLKSVDVIACEDTRKTQILCEKYGISTRLESYHKFSESKKIDFFEKYLREDKDIALVSDAGTPTISDPGSKLIEYARENNYKVIPIIGASACLALLCAVPRDGEEFKFIGFLPRVKSQIESLVKTIKTNTVFYESPKRLISTLEIINNVNPDLKICIGRELTKKFEEIIIDKPSVLIDYFTKNTLKGEIVGMIYPNQIDDIDSEIIEKIEKLKELNLGAKEISSILNKLFDYNKNKVYKICLDL